MNKVERKIKYQGVSLPVFLLDEIKQHLEKYPRRYTSITDFIKCSIRRRIKHDIVEEFKPFLMLERYLDAGNIPFATILAIRMGDKLQNYSKKRLEEIKEEIKKFKEWEKSNNE